MVWKILHNNKILRETRRPAALRAIPARPPVRKHQPKAINRNCSQRPLFNYR